MDIRVGIERVVNRDSDGAVSFIERWPRLRNFSHLRVPAQIVRGTPVRKEPSHTMSVRSTTKGVGRLVQVSGQAIPEAPQSLPAAGFGEYNVSIS